GGTGADFLVGLPRPGHAGPRSLGRARHAPPVVFQAGAALDAAIVAEPLVTLAAPEIALASRAAGQSSAAAGAAPANSGAGGGPARQSGVAGGLCAGHHDWPRAGRQRGRRPTGREDRARRLSSLANGHARRAGGPPETLGG